MDSHPKPIYATQQYRPSQRTSPYRGGCSHASSSSGSSDRYSRAPSMTRNRTLARVKGADDALISQYRQLHMGEPVDLAPLIDSGPLNKQTSHGIEGKPFFSFHRIVQVIDHSAIKRTHNLVLAGPLRRVHVCRDFQLPVLPTSEPPHKNRAFQQAYPDFPSV